jgi:hypothetical protein
LTEKIHAIKHRYKHIKVASTSFCSERTLLSKKTT